MIPEAHELSIDICDHELKDSRPIRAGLSAAFLEEVNR